MCVGSLFKMPKPPQPKRMDPAPSLKAPPPPQETPGAEDLTKGREEEKINTRDKKAREVEKIKKGVGEFDAIDSSSMPQGPEGGVNT